MFASVDDWTLSCSKEELLETLHLQLREGQVREETFTKEKEDLKKKLKNLKQELSDVGLLLLPVVCFHSPAVKSTVYVDRS